MSLELETRHLELADRIIHEGEARIQRQIALVEWLRLEGAGTDAAEDLLESFRQTLDGWNCQRQMIEMEVERSLAFGNALQFLCSWPAPRDSNPQPSGSKPDALSG